MKLAEPTGTWRMPLVHLVTRQGVRRNFLLPSM